MHYSKNIKITKILKGRLRWKIMYDVIIIGGGAAGFSAALYAVRYNLKTLIISNIDGGQITETTEVENYPGIKHIGGLELGQKFREQCEEQGAEVVNDFVARIEKGKSGFKVHASKVHETKTVILAMGSEKTKLSVPGEAEFASKGVSYCATCDGAFFKGKRVGVVGGSDSAAKSALLLSKFAKQVFIIYRRDKLRAEPRTVDSVHAEKKISIIFKANVIEIMGDNVMNAVKLDSGNVLELDGLFIEVGSKPDSELVKNLGIEVDKSGCIVVDAAMATNVKGIFAAGDITTGSNKFRQLITAAAEGAIAANSAYGFVTDESIEC
ncbi:hypothetical protein COV93_04470 [Candidatus Woesearchaeota archaeon CG11_big_fil_rev_8_21_14_0_20_43_8]|nr:MAG: hypothetical protein COV93_04470 [Candidatus Woesearchaeota archaeon CG11_big_fil_rev_8_21_14_0_20_43_8]